MEELNVTTTEVNWNNLSDYVIGLNDNETDVALAKVQLFTGYPEVLLIFGSACCVLFMVIGIPGNLLTVIALARCKKVRNATAILIINLSVSDFLFCCFILPLAASTFWRKSWTHGVLLCRMFPLARYGLVAVSIFTVLAITINRYIMISHPILYPKLFKSRYLYLMIAFIWVIAFGALVPTYLEVWGRFDLDATTGSCTIVPDEYDASPKKILFIIAFLLPSIAIIVCYARILWIVKKTAKKSQAPARMRPLTEIDVTTVEIPETTIPSSEPVKKTDSKSRLTVPCFFSPELSLSCNDGSSREETNNCAPEFKPSSLGSHHAQRIRKSFITTFRRSTAYIKPRMPTKKDKRLLTMIVAIITTFCACHLPITLTKTITQEYRVHPYPNIIGYMLIYLAPCINPLIYVVMSIEYRQAYKNCLNCDQCR